MIAKRRSLAILVLPSIYLGLCVAVGIGVVPSEGSWGWFLPFLAAFPFSILLLPVMKVLPPFLAFGIFGTLWWFAISRVIAAVVTRVSARTRRPT